MAERVRDGSEMVRQMSPRLLAGRYVFRTLEAGAGQAELSAALGMFREEEGLSVIVEAGPDDADAYRQITLDVHSALDGVGLTAAVSVTLAELNIPSNVVAANHHDHIFVPEQMAEAALDALRRLSRGEHVNREKE
ncbi:ACT domain-containing protein [Tropicimonas sp. TH_r6]|uniref:ACT domain-containing protein n=1 Tax=Tropicimonas sp. TH_r6 TaxID=3082085 RepID=UPI002954C48C|nr:ACT domain-containing protein [Tropicimonas sp. TH_r6]MDV7142281.1 ACT domain-containing protein [Tropicimonas sp. TH_r6]